jgi:DNA-binding GntR family transcriptional regulator
VEREPHKSCYVKEIGPNDIKDLFESLMVVEKNLNCFAAELATSQELARIEEACAAVDKAIAGDSQWAISATNLEFHSQICRASHNLFLFRCHQRMRKHAERLSHLAYRREDQRHSPILHTHNREVSLQHNDLVQGLKQRNRTRVEAVSVEHIKYFQDAVIRFIQDVRYV